MRPISDISPNWRLFAQSGNGVFQTRQQWSITRTLVRWIRWIPSVHAIRLLPSIQRFRAGQHHSTSPVDLSDLEVQSLQWIQCVRLDRAVRWCPGSRSSQHSLQTADAQAISKNTLGLHTAVWLQAKVRERGNGLQRRLNAGPVYDAQRRWRGRRELRRYTVNLLRRTLHYR